MDGDSGLFSSDSTSGDDFDNFISIHVVMTP